MTGQRTYESAHERPLHPQLVQHHLVLRIHPRIPQIQIKCKVSQELLPPLILRMVDYDILRVRGYDIGVV